MCNILIVTNKSDLASDFLICRLIELDIQFYRLNCDELDTTGINFSLTATETRTLSTEHNQVDLTRVKGVFYRRKIYPSTSEHLDSSQKFFVSGEIQHLIEGTIWNPHITWVNPITAVDMAERKPYQLRTAASVGLSVPKTLITNNYIEAQNFLQTVKNVICKPIFHGKHNNRAVYTTKVDNNSIFEKEKLGVCPIFLQEEVQKGSDIRLTIIGEDYFPVEIFSPELPILDWRIPNANIIQQQCEVPHEIIIKCKILLKKLGLNYGAFDFVKNNNGDYYFLEVNAAGEWAWLEIELNLPIRDSFIKLLDK